MDLQKFADGFFPPTCIVSVEKKGNGGYGDIRLAAANKKYLDIIDIRIKKPLFYVAPDVVTSFVPNSLYTRYFPQNRSFEEVCFNAAVLKTEMHTYTYLSNIDTWLNIYAMPIDYEDGSICYCAYTATPSRSAYPVLNSINSAQTSNDVLKTCVKLHGADNMKDAMESVISEIRRICSAECCTVLLMNEDEENFSILATDFREGSKIKPVSQFEGFYNIAYSWKAMIGEEGDCIIIQDKKDMEHYSRINHPWYLTLVEAGVESVVLFPLRQGNEILGFIWATNFDTDNTMRIKETLELTTFFISSHIARYKVLKRLRHMSYTDALTGLPNRFACTDRISRLIGKKRKFAAVYIDINHFKSINDTLGLEAGNKVLREIAERWRSIFASGLTESFDYLTRISGDEFLLVVWGYSSEETLKGVIGQYASALSEHMTIDDCDLYVTASFGYAEYPDDASTADEIISYANAAMNEVKRANSSDHVRRFSSDILTNEHTLEIENKIRAALENDSIYFNLQPQYDMEHKLRGFEALARMKDNDGNVISPCEFIPVAEKVGLIDKVDSMVFKKAAGFFSSLLRKNDLSLMLSLNASVRHLMKNDFLDEISSLLEESGIPADRLEIEITESIMIDSADKALQCINELKKIGVHIAIDDFGTGYSSLSYLYRFPADLLKIDKSFIDKMNTNESSRQYVAAIISIGHIMGFEVISEGVEDQSQLETLKNTGCDYIQGFIWGRPLSAEDAEKLVTGFPPKRR